METAELLFLHVFRYFGIPEDIVSDRRPQFVSRVWRTFFYLLGVTVSLSSGYHPQWNGQMERKIQKIRHFLRTFCHSHQNSRSQLLGWTEYAENSLWKQATGHTQFQCYLDTSHHCSHGPGNSRTFHLSITGSGRARSSSSSEDSATAKDPGRWSTGQHSQIPTWAVALALYAGYPDALALQEVKSQIHWSLSHSLSN